MSVLCGTCDRKCWVVRPWLFLSLLRCCCSVGLPHSRGPFCVRLRETILVRRCPLQAPRIKLLSIDTSSSSLLPSPSSSLPLSLLEALSFTYSCPKKFITLPTTHQHTKTNPTQNHSLNRPIRTSHHHFLMGELHRHGVLIWHRQTCELG